jgi:hypothetical protein
MNVPFTCQNCKQKLEAHCAPLAGSTLQFTAQCPVCGMVEDNFPSLVIEVVRVS